MTLDVLKLNKIMNKRAQQERDEQFHLHTQVPMDRTYICLGNVTMPVAR
ncbi:MAG: hypothetical protein K6F37_07135 [Lachnospiraceae bacterium]|nr:hypothetical protein [Lachnospiraceae bacterium]